jgi:hypothetical protein
MGTGKQPIGTTGVGKDGFKEKLIALIQFGADQWVCIVLIVLAFILGLIVRGLFLS